MVHSVLWHSLKSNDVGSVINRGGGELQRCIASGNEFYRIKCSFFLYDIQ